MGAQGKGTGRGRWRKKSRDSGRGSGFWEESKVGSEGKPPQRCRKEPCLSLATLHQPHPGLWLRWIVLISLRSLGFVYSGDKSIHNALGASCAQWQVWGPGHICSASVVWGLVGHLLHLCISKGTGSHPFTHCLGLGGWG